MTIEAQEKPEWFKASQNAKALEQAIEAMAHHGSDETHMHYIGAMLVHVRREAAELWIEYESEKKKERGVK